MGNVALVPAVSPPNNTPVLILNQVGNPVIVHVHDVQIARPPSGEPVGGIVTGDYIEGGISLDDTGGN
jgi:hypothetical protein